MSRKRQTNNKAKVTEKNEPAVSVDKQKKQNRYAIISLVVLFSIVYLSTMLPGVSSGDSAELQYCSKLLGICHPPGYQIEVTFGKLFTFLPIGDVAWRINFMMAVFGTTGCLAMYGAIRRITGFILPGVVAATIIGFSSIYWTHCLHAEAYVFYSSFLLVGLYTFVRFVQNSKVVWLYLTAVLVGICVADRASELSVLPGFLFALIFAWKKLKVNFVHYILALLVFVLPFVYTMFFYYARTSQDYLHQRDSGIRNRVLSKMDYTEFVPRTSISFNNIKHRAKNRLGMGYSKDAKFQTDRVERDLDKYAWLLTGAGGFGDRYEPDNPMQRLQGSGSSIGLLGLAMGVLAIVAWRKNYGWVAFGIWFFVGNLLFILWHSRWDNLTFTIPGLIGLAVLAGLGAVGPGKWGNEKRRYVFQACCLIAPLFLIVTNYRYVDMSTPETQKTLEYNNQLAAAPWPKGSAFVDRCWPGMTLRYLFYVQAQREDIHVVYDDNNSNWQKVIKHFSDRDHPVYLRAGYVDAKTRKLLAQRTDPQIAKLGFVRINPK